eukprot:Sspe_Gene.111939::Locus_94122_Transcript_1_1_Confidence_1.000_Length_717::g.111939::m.111939
MSGLRRPYLGTGELLVSSSEAAVRGTRGDPRGALCGRSSRPRPPVVLVRRQRGDFKAEGDDLLRKGVENELVSESLKCFVSCEGDEMGSVVAGERGCSANSSRCTWARDGGVKSS